VKESGYIFDITGDSIKTLSRRHHEMYLSNPCKVAVEKMIETGMPKLLAWLFTREVKRLERWNNQAKNSLCYYFA
jgi:hypothetical protein